MIETLHRGIIGRYFSKQVFLKTSQYSQETPVFEYLFEKVAGVATLLKRDSNTGVFL